MADNNDRRDRNRSRNDGQGDANAAPTPPVPEKKINPLTAGALIIIALLAIPQQKLWDKVLKPLLRTGKNAAEWSWEKFHEFVHEHQAYFYMAWDTLKTWTWRTGVISVLLGVVGTYLYHDLDVSAGRWFVLAGGLLAVTYVLGLKTFAGQLATLILGLASTAASSFSVAANTAKKIAGKLGVDVEDAGMKDKDLAHQINLMSEKIREMLDVIAAGLSVGFVLWTCFPHWITLVLAGTILLVAEMRFAIGAVKMTDHEGNVLRIKRNLRGWQFAHDLGTKLIAFLVALMAMSHFLPKTTAVISIGKIDAWLADPSVPSMNGSLAIMAVLALIPLALYAFAAIKKHEGLMKVAKLSPWLSLGLFVFLLWRGTADANEVAGKKGAMPPPVTKILKSFQKPDADFENAEMPGPKNVPSNDETRYVDQASPNRPPPASDEAFNAAPPSMTGDPVPARTRPSAPTPTRRKANPKHREVIEQPDRAYDDLEALLADAEKVE